MIGSVAACTALISNGALATGKAIKSVVYSLPLKVQREYDRLQTLLEKTPTQDLLTPKEAKHEIQNKLKKLKELIPRNTSL